MTLDATHACVVDLDGVVWLAGHVLDGAVEGVEELRRHGVPVLFATNNAAPTIGEVRRRLQAIGIDAADHEIATSAQAVASMLSVGQRAFVVGESGLLEALGDRGVASVDHTPDVVVVGLTDRFDYELCDRAASFIRGGARFIASNTDPTLPAPGGLRPGAGAIVAAIATASGVEPEVAGKPFAPMCQVLVSRVTPGAVIGDRVSTDGKLAAALGVPFAHVRSDVAEPAGAGSIVARTLLDAVHGLMGT